MTSSTRERLEAIIGRKMTALIGDDELRLQRTLTVARVLYVGDDRSVVQAWLMGQNPKLDDQSPLRLLREGDERSFRAVLGAARSDSQD